MLDKLKFNNLIISNAKVIETSRIQLVRKIIQKMRKLKNSLEKRPDDEKTIVKQRKCVAIVERVKKIKREDVIRNVLQLEKNPNKIVTNSHSTPEEVAIALFATNKTMQELAKTFRQELNYNEAEAEGWKKALIEIGKLKEKKRRRKKRAEKREKQPKKALQAEADGTEVKSTKKSSKKTKNVSLESDESGEVDIVEPKLETINKNAARKTNAKPLETTDKHINAKVLIETEEDVDETTKTENDDVKPPKKVQNKELRTSTHKAEKPEKPMKYLSGYARLEDLPSEAHAPKKNASREPVKVGVVDPFFITATGEPYIANIEVRPERENVEYANDPSKEFARNSTKFKYGSARNAQNPKKPRTNSVNDKQAEEDLHPSWQAKKKLSSIAEFRGKKITFDDGVAIEKPANRANSKYTAQTDLHPSWAAKQKLKPVITAFQGKKITFGDDE